MQVIVAVGVIATVASCAATRSDGEPVAAPREAGQPVQAGAADVPGAQAGSAASEQLATRLSLDKSAYRLGEPIGLTVSVVNGGDQDVTLVHPDYWGVSEIIVRSAAGVRVAPPRTFKGKRKAPTELMMVPAGGTASHRFEDSTTYTCCNAYSYRGISAGVYEVQVEITNPPKQVERLPAGWKADWQGTLRTEPVRFTVAP